jgi:hypothetical protein
MVGKKYVVIDKSVLKSLGIGMIKKMAHEDFHTLKTKTEAKKLKELLVSHGKDVLVRKVL